MFLCAKDKLWILQTTQFPRLDKNSNSGQSGLIAFLKPNKKLEDLRTKLLPKLCSQRYNGERKKPGQWGKASVFTLLKSKEVLSFNWLHVNPEIHFLKFCTSMKQNRTIYLFPLLQPGGLAVCSEWTHHFSLSIFPLLQFYFGILYMWGFWTWKL